MVTNLNSDINMLYVSRNRNSIDDMDILICKNLVVQIKGMTNRMDFVVAILNASLPENERIDLSPSP